MARLSALVDALRGEGAGLRGDHATPHEGAGSGGAAAVVAAVEEVRDEFRRAGVEIAAQAAHHAERAVTGVAESSAEAHRALATALADVRVQLTRAIEEVQRVALAGGERATQALAQTADLDRRGRELEALRGSLAQLRAEALRRSEETEARFGVRLDSIVAGVEAETRAVRDGLWDRVSGAEQRLQEAEALLARIRVELPQATAQALEGVAAVYGEIGELRDGLGTTDERLAELERQRAAPGGLGGLVACVRDEIVAAVMTVISIGAVVGRLTLSLVR
jgi:hypothetical protein